MANHLWRAIVVGAVVSAGPVAGDDPCQLVTATERTTQRICLRTDSRGRYECNITDSSDEHGAWLMQTCEFMPFDSAAPSTMWKCVSSPAGVLCTPQFKMTFKRRAKFYVEF